jgi:hypothetical protein
MNKYLMCVDDLNTSIGGPQATSYRRAEQT